MTAQGRIFKALLRLLARLPLRVNRGIGDTLGWIAHKLPNRTRNVGRRNLELCFPELDGAQRRALLRAFLTETGRGLAELGIVWYGDLSKVLGLARRVVGRAHLVQAMAGGRGVLVISPHLGSWEWLVQYLAAEAPCTFFYREPKDPGIDQVVTAGRQRTGAIMVRAGARGVRSAFRALKDGQIVGVMPDQQPKRGQGEFSPFFGQSALTMVLASRLAQRSEAAVLICCAIRLPGAGGFEVHFEPAEKTLRDPDLGVSVAALNSQIEALVRRWPAQYQWGYKRFSIRPAGENPLY